MQNFKPTETLKVFFTSSIFKTLNALKEIFLNFEGEQAETFSYLDGLSW